MSNEESALGASRRSPRQGAGGSPVGSWLTIALAVVAVIAGFLILRNINQDSGGALPNRDSSSEADSGAPGPGDTLVDVSVPVTEAPTTTVAPERVTTGASVLVANANTVGGSAGNMTRTLELAGYTVEEPVNATGAPIETSIVYFDGAQASAEDVARSVARDLGGLEVLPVPTPPPTEDGDLDGAGVLVLLGDEQAGKTIEELAPAEAAAGSGGVPAPDPSGADAPATDPADGAAEDDGAG